LGKPSEAESILGPAVEVSTQALGDSDSATLKLNTLRALAYLQLAQYDTCMLLAREQFEAYGMPDKSDLPRRLECALIYAKGARLGGKWDQGRAVIETILRELRDDKGVTPGYMADALDMMGMGAAEAGDFDAAKTALAEALELRKQESSRPDGWERFQTQAWLGAVMRELGDAERARPLLGEAVSGLERQSERIPPYRREEVLAHARAALEQASPSKN
jgi:tetratricopeptide (TPR) repeat protein